MARLTSGSVNSITPYSTDPGARDEGFTSIRMQLGVPVLNVRARRIDNSYARPSPSAIITIAALCECRGHLELSRVNT